MTKKDDTEVKEAVKIDSKIKLAALAILNFKKLIAILITLGFTTAIVALAVSGWTCGNVKKDSAQIEIKK
jgi:hypothetical protein